MIYTAMFCQLTRGIYGHLSEKRFKVNRYSLYKHMCNLPLADAHIRGYRQHAVTTVRAPITVQLVFWLLATWLHCHKITNASFNWYSCLIGLGDSCDRPHATACVDSAPVPCQGSFKARSSRMCMTCGRPSVRHLAGEPKSYVRET